MTNCSRTPTNNATEPVTRLQDTQHTPTQSVTLPAAMTDADIAFFIFGTTAAVFLALLLVSYALYLCVFRDDDDNDSNGNNGYGDPYNVKLPPHLTLNTKDYRTLVDWNGFSRLSDIEQLTYLMSVCYCWFQNPVLLPNELNSNNVTTESLLIRDRGISAFHFQDYYDQIVSLYERFEHVLNTLPPSQSSSSAQNTTDSELQFEIDDETTALLSDPESDFRKNKLLNLLRSYNYTKLVSKRPPYVVEDLIELNFQSSEIGKYSHSSVLNLPVPTVNRKNNITYFECKVLEFNPSQTLLSMGLVCNKDYPNFQLPGYIPFSFAIESDGNVRCTTRDSNPLGSHFESDVDKTIVLPKLNEGDVIGLGYRAISGSIFLTHNGKLIHELVKQFKFQLYPCIGVKNLSETEKPTPCKVSVNLGQLGFVYIEANVKKLGFCESKNDGLIGAPPIYNKVNLKNEIILDKGDEMPPNYSNDESFFGPVVGSSTATEKNAQVHEENELHEEEEQQHQEPVPEQAPLPTAPVPALSPSADLVTPSERTATPISDPPSYNTDKDLNPEQAEEVPDVDGNRNGDESTALLAETTVTPVTSTAEPSVMESTLTDLSVAVPASHSETDADESSALLAEAPSTSVTPEPPATAPTTSTSDNKGKSKNKNKNKSRPRKKKGGKKKSKTVF
jgi:hypothetical protein